MNGTVSAAELARVVRDSLFVASDAYVRRPDGSLVFNGERPGPGWWAHGYCPRLLVMVVGSRLERRLLWKRRWLEVSTGRTTHSRPPDDAASVWFCTLVVCLELWSWLDGASLLHAASVLGEQEWRPSRRTVQRWLTRALAAPMAFQQAIRRALIERSEPRPVELLFPCGLSPPESLARRCWSNRPGVEQVWRGIAMLLGGALELELAVPALLAEARGRLPTPNPSYML